jgi:hypothetical protein
MIIWGQAKKNGGNLDFFFLFAIMKFPEAETGAKA